MQTGAGRASVMKIFEVVLCATQFPLLLEWFTLSGPLWYGAGVFAGSVFGYWLPPVERSIGFRRWLAFSALLGFTVFSLKFVHISH